MRFERPIDRIQSEQGYFFAFVPVEPSGLWMLHADRERVLAESAFREKDSEAAIEHYEAALDADPTWPNGNRYPWLGLASTAVLSACYRYRPDLLVTKILA